jgi:metallo-beta-lactamase family protein
MRITFIGGARTVTGSSFLISTDMANILVDSGMFQGRRELTKRNQLEYIYDPSEIDAVILTHAHIDHSGLIPKLVKAGFRGKIFSTKATADLCELMLLDSAHIQEMDSRWRSKRNFRKGLGEVLPLYTTGDATRSLKQFKRLFYDQKFEAAQGIEAVFRDAGHIIGSSIVELLVKDEGKETKLVFSGDVGVADQPIIRDPSTITDADFLFIESTYGNRLHRNIDESKEELKEAILSTVEGGGKVIIPSFAVGRTQELIFYLAELYRDGFLKDVPVFVDSPMATSATEIIRDNPQCFDKETHALLSSGETPLNLPTLRFTRTTKESIAINQLAGGAIIISASGMCTAGRIKHHLRHNLWRPEATIIFVGFQAEGTLGRLIVSGAEEVKIMGEEIQVNARIFSIGGFSAHADRNGLLNWASHFRGSSPTVFVIHGEEKVSLSFARALKSELAFDAYVPHWGETIKLKENKEFQTLSITETGEMVELKGSRLLKDLSYIKSKISKIEAAGTQDEDKLVYEKIKRIKKLLMELED